MPTKSSGQLFRFRPPMCLWQPDHVQYGDGDGVVVSAPNAPVRFLLVSGRPIGEPVAWYGPIVMNTQEELRLAFKEYEEGTFIKHHVPGMQARNMSS